MRRVTMNEELEQIKSSLQSVNELIDIKGNPVVTAGVAGLVGKIPVIGDLINSSIDRTLEDFQQNKEQELIDVILSDSSAITTEMVNDVEFLINYARVVDAVRRLASNDKVAFFGNLIRNGYLSGEHINVSRFDEYINILNTMSYREIQYLVDYKKFCEESIIKSKVSKITRKNTYNNKWYAFSKEYAKTQGLTIPELYSIFIRLKQTGFLEEEYETESGDVDENDNTFSELSVEGNGFFITKSFLDFYDMVLKME